MNQTPLQPMNLNEIKKIESVLKYSFNNKKLLTTALTHRSCLNSPKHQESYERLEFLGDAILEKMISVFLYHKYPDKMEGFLTAARSSLVRTESLSKISSQYKINEFIIMSKGEEQGGGRQNPSILEDVIESLIGALYLDGGPEASQKFFDLFILPDADINMSEKQLKDAKSSFQEQVQALGYSSPVYETIKSDGPDHEKTFLVQVSVDNRPIATGEGKSKQQAEQTAAKNAIQSLDKLKK